MIERGSACGDLSCFGGDRGSFEEWRGNQLGPQDSGGGPSAAPAVLGGQEDWRLGDVVSGEGRLWISRREEGHRIDQGTRRESGLDQSMASMVRGDGGGR